MNLQSQLETLETAGLEELRAAWRRHVGVPPKLRSPQLLRQILAWRLQVKAHGSFDPRTRTLLLREPKGPEALLEVGTMVGREWRGVRHEVEMSEAGPLYRGRHWTSLSEVAREITGTRWNGPKFFGLRQQT
jgi:hypothetical protein